MTTPSVFISYSHVNESWKERVAGHLGVLAKQGILEVWDDRRIRGGDTWFDEIKRAIDQARVAILLITMEFLTSDFILSDEIPLLLARKAEEGTRLIPVIVEPCAFDLVPWLDPINARPTNGRVLSTMAKYEADQALADLAKEVANLVSAYASTVSSATHHRPERIYFPQNFPATDALLIGRDQELAILDTAWSEPKTRMLTLIAPGGVGKTALVNFWLARMWRDNYRNADRVYAWSFYTQGTSEEQQTTADEFLTHALTWFGETTPPILAWEKGQRLAELVAYSNTLLVLDGLEPLQYQPGPMGGRLRDEGLAGLLRTLVRLTGDGLCLITSRERVADIDHAVGNALQTVELDTLLPADGGKLLAVLGVTGSEFELQATAREFGGHALALLLLGHYLVAVHGGDIRKRTLVAKLTDEPDKGKHAWRVMATYERWLANSTELAILRIMGLFDRPASDGALAVLREAPVIEDLSEPLQGLDNANWLFSVDRLRKLRLFLDKEGSLPDSLDCHPLVREYFGERLRTGFPSAWREGNDRLYLYYRDLPKKKFPTTLEEMAPLFAAVTHGCRAGRHREALEEVYWERISRGDEAYNTLTLGAFGLDLAILANFFTSLWDRPASWLIDSDQAFVLRCAGFDLRALGWLVEAAGTLRAELELNLGRPDWAGAGRAASNLSEVSLSLGEVKEALAIGLQSMTLAEQSGETSLRITSHSIYGDALHQAGQFNEAESIFQAAEDLQLKFQPNDHLLNSIQDVKYCDLLINLGRQEVVRLWEEERERKERNDKDEDGNKLPSLDTGQYHLNVGQAYTALGITGAASQSGCGQTSPNRPTGCPAPSPFSPRRLPS